MSGTLDYKNYSKRTLSRNRVRSGNNNCLNDHAPAPFHPSLLMRFTGHRQRVLCVDLQQSLLTSSEQLKEVQKSANARYSHFSMSKEHKEEQERDNKQAEQLLSAPKVLSSGADGACMLWDVRPNMRALRFTTHTAYIHGCAFAPWRVCTQNISSNSHVNDNNNISYLACCGHDGYIRLWRPTGRSTQSRLAYPIRSDILLDDYVNDSHVYDTSYDIDVNTTENYHTLNQLYEVNNYTSLENNWENNCKNIMYKGNGCNLKWNKSCHVNSREEDELYCPINSTNQFSVNSKHRNANSVLRHVWPNREPEVSVCMWKAHAGATRAIAFAHDGSSHLYTAGDDKSVKCWDVEYSTGTSTSAPLTSLSFTKVNTKRVNTNHTSRTRIGRLLGARFVGGFSANISEIPYQSFLNAQMDSGDFNKFSVTAHTNWVRCLAVQSPFTSHSYFHYIASGGDDSVIHVWDTRSRKLAHVFYETDCGIRSLAFAPNGYHLASGDVQGHINVFDLRYTDGTNNINNNNKSTTYGLVQRYEQAHGGVVNSISFAPNGNWLLSAGDDAECKLWDVQEGYLYCTVQAHKGPVKSCKFSDDGNFFVTGGDDGAVLLWNSGIPHMTRRPVISAVQVAQEHAMESNVTSNGDVINHNDNHNNISKEYIKNNEKRKVHKSCNRINDHVANSMNFNNKCNCNSNNMKSIDNNNNISRDNNNIVIKNGNARCSRAEKMINNCIARLERGGSVPKQTHKTNSVQSVKNKLQHHCKFQSPEMHSTKTTAEAAYNHQDTNKKFEENGTNSNGSEMHEADNMLQRESSAHVLANNSDDNDDDSDDNNYSRWKKRGESERRSFTRSEERYSHLGHEIPLDEKRYDVVDNETAAERERRVKEASGKTYNTNTRNSVNSFSNTHDNNGTAIKTSEENILESTSSENSNSNKRQHESIVKESKITSQTETSAHGGDDAKTEDNNSNNKTTSSNSSSKSDPLNSNTSHNSKTSFIQSAHKLQQIHKTLFTIRQLITEERDGDEINENADAQSIEELKQLMNDVIEQQRLYVNQLEKHIKEEEVEK